MAFKEDDLMKILRYIKNTLYFFLNGGFKNGGVTYVNVELLDDAALLKGKNVVITGGGSGIGLAIAKRCIESGANVLITGRNEENLKVCVEKLGEKASYYVQDIRKVHEKNYDKIFGKFHQVDCLVNNAGVCPTSSSFPECEYDLYNDIFDTNLRGLYFFTQAYVRQCMEKKVKGVIVNVASGSGLVGATSPYGLSKRAVVSFTEGIAKQCYKYGIRCNAVAPGVTLSNITSWSSMYEPEGNLYDKKMKTKRVLRAEEIAEVTVFLLSNRSVCVNGQTLACDNGSSLAANSVE